jgi:outer membrane cobalamin receptor
MARLDRTWTLSRRASLAATGIVLMTGCSFIHPPSHELPADAGHLISSQSIQASGGTTAWDVLKRTSFLSTQDAKNGGPGRMWYRGRGSILLDETPLVAIDGVPQTDFHILGTLLANAIDNIRILSSSEGTVLYGIRAGGGAILIQTRTETPEPKQ